MNPNCIGGYIYSGRERMRADMDQLEAYLNEELLALVGHLRTLQLTVQSFQ